MLTRRQSRAFAWDVVNEAISDAPIKRELFKPNVWHPTLHNYVDIAFQQAATFRYSSDVKLFYNDCLVERSAGPFDYKSDKMFNMIHDAIQRGAPVDGVGLQLHIDIRFTNVAGVKRSLQRHDDLGVEAHIAELDVGCAMNGLDKDCVEWGEDQLMRQAEAYAAALQSCLEVKACTVFEAWGFTDLYSWRGIDQRPLPFDEHHLAKPAYQALVDTLQGNTSWVDAYYSRSRRL